MGVTEQRMEQLGITLQQTDWRGKGAVEAVLAGDMLYISAHYPVDENGTPVYVGRVGAEIDEAAAYQAARLCGLNMLRTIQAYIGSLDRVDYFVKALGLVNSAGDFYNMPAVMNGYSDLMVEIFGHRGQHARAAMGAYVLPGNMPVSVDAIVKIRRYMNRCTVAALAQILRWKMAITPQQNVPKPCCVLCSSGTAAWTASTTWCAPPRW